MTTNKGQVHPLVPKLRESLKDFRLFRKIAWRNWRKGILPYAQYKQSRATFLRWENETKARIRKLEEAH